ncbi:MAG: hypothetical protein AAFR61_19540 [Bacteroidota bacterium]
MASVHFTPEQLNERFEFAQKFKNIVFGLIGIGIALILVGALFFGDSHEEATDSHAAITTEQVSNAVPVADTPDDHGEGGHAHHHRGTEGRLVSNFLLCSLYFLTISMGALFFLAVHQIGNGGWHTAIRRVPEAMTTYLPVAAVGFVALFFFMDVIYEWLILPPGVDALIDTKRAFLNRPAFIIRNVIFFGIWIGAALWLRRLSIRQDTEGGLSHFHLSTRISAAFVFLFAFSYSLFAVDWIKSLEPHWFSTIFGVYVFAGSFQSAMIVTGFLLYFLKRQGYMSYVNDSHFHDVFKYAFGFSVFWGYIFVAQYLLIWYSNIPEEGIYYVKRYLVDSHDYVGGNFIWLFWTNVLCCFLIPFLGFMMRDAKRDPRWFIPVGLVVLYGHWQDLFVMIMPGAMGTEWGIGLIEVGFFSVFAGLFLYVVFNGLSKANLAAANHPYMEESLHHTTGPI